MKYLLEYFDNGSLLKWDEGKKTVSVLMPQFLRPFPFRYCKSWVSFEGKISELGHCRSTVCIWSL